MKKEITPIAHVRTCYAEKFGIPRQSGLVAEAEGQIIFEPEFRKEEALRRIEEFSHLWLVFGFHQAPWDGALTARPPRLGGNERVGVFATRSPFRPNGLGLSVVELIEVVRTGEGAPFLKVSGVDLVDGTPLYDLKPYIAYADAIEGTVGGYAAESPPLMEVRAGKEIEPIFEGLGIGDRALIINTLSCDPRPATHEGEGREYGCRIAHRNIRWRVEDGICWIVGIKE